MTIVTEHQLVTIQDGTSVLTIDCADRQAPKVVFETTLTDGGAFKTSIPAALSRLLDGASFALKDRPCTAT